MWEPAAHLRSVSLGSFARIITGPLSHDNKYKYKYQASGNVRTPGKCMVPVPEIAACAAGQWAEQGQSPSPHAHNVTYCRPAPTRHSTACAHNDSSGGVRRRGGWWRGTRSDVNPVTDHQSPPGNSHLTSVRSSMRTHLTGPIRQTGKMVYTTTTNKKRAVCKAKGWCVSNPRLFTTYHCPKLRIFRQDAERCASWG